jgi:hypothetical protein
MKIILNTLLLTLVFLSTFAQVKVRGYYRKNGTYVQPHYRSNPDGNPYNNYSYPGNVNPYTGKVATGNPDTYIKNYDKSNSSKKPAIIYPEIDVEHTIYPHPSQVATDNPDTYLNNYYKNANNNKLKNSTITLPENDYEHSVNSVHEINGNAYSYISYSLYRDSYHQIATTKTKRKHYYKLQDTFGNQIGYATSNNFRKYAIYDNADHYNGSVKVTKKGTYYVYDSNGIVLYSNKHANEQKTKRSFKGIKSALRTISTIGLVVLSLYLAH